MKVVRFFGCLALLGALACASRGEQLKLYKFTPEPSNGRLEESGLVVAVERAQTAAGATNYVLHVTVANTGTAPIEFKAAALELVDAEGITHPALESSPGLAISGILRDQPIAPGQKLKGALYFQTAGGEARSKKLTLRLGKTSVAFANVGFLTNEDLDSHNSFRD